MSYTDFFPGFGVSKNEQPGQTKRNPLPPHTPNIATVTGTHRLCIHILHSEHSTTSPRHPVLHTPHGYLGAMIQSNNYQINEYKKIGFLQIIVMRLDVHRSSEEVM